MTDQATQEPGDIKGQAELEPGGTQTTQSGPGDEEGQSSAGQGQETTRQPQGPQGTEDSFFDPRDLDGKPELQAAYKEMQRNYSKKMEQIKASRQKIEAYDAFAADPVSQLQQMARQYGYNLTRAEAAQQLNEQQQANSWEPKSWDEVLTKAEERAYQRLRQEQEPLLTEVKNLRKSNLESYLDANAPDWRTYEDDMMTALREHPTLVNNPLALYKLAVPEEVLQSRATQQALKKMQDKGKSASVSGASTTTKKSGTKMPDKAVSFDEAVKIAEAKLAEEGIKRPGL